MKTWMFIVLAACAAIVIAQSGSPQMASSDPASPAAGTSAATTAPALPSNLSQMQLTPEKHPGDWVLYGNNYGAWRHSSLTDINKSNLSRLHLAWSLDTGLHSAFEASPIVVNGVMYLTTPWNQVLAVDAASGKQLWRYVYPVPEKLALCCDAVNRGAGVGAGKVVFTTVDAHLLALDAATGKAVWDVKMADPDQGYSATVAPQIIGDKAIIGISGGDYGIRGFIDAYDISTGKHLWRFWTIPGPGEPGHDTWEGESWKTGGGPVWMAPTYDPATNTLYAGVGNPGPDLYGDNRKGDNLYTDCIVALDANTGKLKWHYQTVPHDVWDLDSVLEPVLADITVDGRPVKAVMFASKNGYFYVLDRVNGKFVYALQYTHQLNWGKVMPDGSVQIDKSKYPVRDKFVEVYPGAAGGKEWCPVSYDPKRKLMFVPVVENGMRHKVILQQHRDGFLYWGGASLPIAGKAYGHVSAIDVENKKIAWSTRTEFPMLSGITSTASGLVIAGTPDRKMLILDADSGKILWQYIADSGFHSAPVVYAINGKQYIGFANGWGGWVTGYDIMGTPKLQDVPKKNTMYVFTLQ